VVAFALGPLPPVEGLAPLVMGDAAESGAVQHALKDLVAAPRPPPVARGSRRSEHGSDTCCCGKRVGRGEPSQVSDLREELEDLGNQFQTEEVEDSLLGLARELLPDTPAAQWDAEWAHNLCKDALAHLARAHAGLSAKEKDTVDLSVHVEWDERMHEAGLANDPVAFRVALDSWTRAGLETMERLRIKGGAA
jgi:hypothetical protein